MICSLLKLFGEYVESALVCTTHLVGHRLAVKVGYLDGIRLKQR